MNYVERILTLMKEKNISAHKLEVDCELANASVQGWRNGRCKPSVLAVIRIAEYFDVSLDFLLKGENYKEKGEKNLWKIQILGYGNVVNVGSENSKIEVNSIPHKNIKDTEGSLLKMSKQEKTDETTSVLGNGTLGEFYFEVNTQCPMCHYEIKPQFVKYVVCDTKDKDIIVFYFCPCCKRVYAVSYNKIKLIQEGTPYQQIVSYEEEKPLTSCDSSYTPYFPPIRKLPQQFLDNKQHFTKTISAYNDAQLIEGYGIKNFIGSAYRKVIDMLIHEFIIFNGEQLDKNIPLQQLINKFLYDEQVKEFAIAINYLGNDDLHYFNKHENYNYEDIKELFDVIIEKIKRDISHKKAKKIIEK